jgi:signal transduction histidine kinase
VTTSLRNEDLTLRDALDFVPQGIAVFDSSLRLSISNTRYRNLLNLPENLASPGTALNDIALYLAHHGDLGSGDPTTLANERVALLTQNETSVSQRLGGSGQTLEFHSARLPDGGLVVSFADVSARVEAEEALERVAHSLEGRVAERTATLTRVNAELEIARTKADAANRDKTRFLAAASHDLLQPLNAVRLYTATLIERAGGTDVAELAHSIEA